jgi:hypothetical protein
MPSSTLAERRPCLGRRPEFIAGWWVCRKCSGEAFKINICDDGSAVIICANGECGQFWTARTIAVRP